MASGIAFNVLLCIVPAMLSLLYWLGLWLVRKSVFDAVSSQLQTFLPEQAYRDMIMGALRKQTDITLHAKQITGLIGIFGTLWAGSALFATVRKALNMIYGFPETRSFLFHRVKDIIMVLAFGTLAIIAASIAPISMIALHYGGQILPGFIYRATSGMAPSILSASASFAMFVLLYRFLSHQTFPLSSAITGAVTATVVWECAKALFVVYLSRFSSLGIVYGTYAFLAATALWIYFSAMVFIFGGIVTRVHWERH